MLVIGVDWLLSWGQLINHTFLQVYPVGLYETLVRLWWSRNNEYPYVIGINLTSTPQFLTTNGVIQSRCLDFGVKLDQKVDKSFGRYAEADGMVEKSNRSALGFSLKISARN